MVDDPEHTTRWEPIYSALWKPRLWFGCHPALLLAAAVPCLITVPMGLLSHNLLWMLLGFVVLFGSLWPLRALARKEPEIAEVFPRYLKYAHHYPAVGSVGSPMPQPRRHQR
jgi:type IV secretory pathway TrbD component